MLVTKRQAIQRLRNETNRSYQWCEATVKYLATEKDGERWKISTHALNKAIAKANEPPPAKDTGIRPISAKKAQRLRERCF